MAILSLKEGMEKKIFKIIIIIFWYFWIKELPFECNNAHLSGLFLGNLKIESTLAHRPILVELLSKDHQTTNVWTKPQMVSAILSVDLTLDSQKLHSNTQV